MTLPPELWSSRYELEWIRDFARHRMLSPDFLLGAVLARCATLADHRLCLPAVVVAPAPLGLYVCGIGPSSAGKSGTLACARGLVPNGHTGVNDSLALGSGEGLVESFWSDEEVVDPVSGKTKREPVQAIRSALVDVDEGKALHQLNARQGSTLSSTLLTMWSGAPVGTTTVKGPGRHGPQRRLSAGTYRLSLTMGLQPENAATLLDGVGDGTPQRFVLFGLTDPDAGEHPAPTGELLVNLPTLTTMDTIARRLHNTWPGDDRLAMGVHPDITRELRDLRISLMRGESDGDEESSPLSGHDAQNRLRVASSFALLDGRLDIGEEDWWLAGLVMLNSIIVRTDLVQSAKRQREAARMARVEEMAAGRLAGALAIEEAAIEACASRIVAIVQSRGGADRKDIRGNLSRPQRRWLDEGLERALQSELIRRDGAGSFAPA